MTLGTVFALALLMFQNTSAVATFQGEFRSADKKYVIVAIDEGETMRMFITGSTKFIRDGKPARPAAFQAGERVTVDAKRDLRMNMLAVRIEARTPAPKSPTPQSPAQ